MEERMSNHAQRAQFKRPTAPQKGAPQKTRLFTLVPSTRGHEHLVLDIFWQYARLCKLGFYPEMNARTKLCTFVCSQFLPLLSVDP